MQSSAPNWPWNGSRAFGSMPKLYGLLVPNSVVFPKLYGNCTIPKLHGQLFLLHSQIVQTFCCCISKLYRLLFCCILQKKLYWLCVVFPNCTDFVAFPICRLFLAFRVSRVHRFFDVFSKCENLVTLSNCTYCLQVTFPNCTDFSSFAFPNSSPLRLYDSILPFQLVVKVAG